MKKSFFILLIVPMLLLCNFKTAYAEELQIDSKYAILYNMDTGEVLYEHNSNEKTSIASLTKIMTCIVAIENIDNLNNTVTLNWNVFTGLAEANASVAGFKYGDKVTYMDLLMGAMLPSGADATRALALNISGSEDEFVKMMNKKAEELNLTNTHFANTTGLESENHYSTVQDIATLLKYALTNETFYKIYTTREYTASNNLKFYSTLKKISNNYTIDVSNIIGSKTGYTDEAGLCMSSIANYNNVNYLLVTAGADYRGNTPRQLLDAIKIYGYFDANYSYKNFINVGDIIEEINIKYSNNDTYQIKSPKTISKFVNNSFNLNELSYQYDGITTISYKNKINEKLGTINILHNNIVVDSLDIYLTDVIEFNLLAFLVQTKIIYVIGTLILLLIFIILKKKVAK